MVGNNEDLKDDIYYYFNSKYAREDYETEFGEAFSLTQDTDHGKYSSFDVLFKYLRVVDDDVMGPSDSQIGNIKHLHGAVRLIRRSLTDTNPALAMLNAYCLLFLGVGDNKNLANEMRNSYISAYKEFRERSINNLKDFYVNMKRFKEEIQKNPLYMPDAQAAEKAQNYLEQCMKECNSSGGMVECIISGVPAGIGEPAFEKLDAALAKAIFSIGAVKGFEIGDGMNVADSTGLQNNDGYYVDEKAAAKNTATIPVVLQEE